METKHTPESQIATIKLKRIVSAVNSYDELLEALRFHNTKPLHPDNPKSTYKTLAGYNRDYKIWDKKFEELKLAAIAKAAE